MGCVKVCRGEMGFALVVLVYLGQVVLVIEGPHSDLRGLYRTAGRVGGASEARDPPECHICPPECDICPPECAGRVSGASKARDPPECDICPPECHICVTFLEVRTTSSGGTSVTHVYSPGQLADPELPR
eukprot:5987188-Pyramimonas_sp.AAC.2